MKKLIAISVVFALVAGVAFAVDLGGAVIGTVNVIKADSSGAKVTGGASMDRVRIDGGGEVADGQFGGWIRVEGVNTVFTEGTLTDHSWETAPLRAFKAHGNAWWKPIDQLKLRIGGNPDGFWGKDGNAAWGFYQTAGDTGVVNVGNAWGGGYSDSLHMRQAFFGGFGDEQLSIEITPVDIVGINIAIPFFNGGDIGKIFMGSIAQIDLNMSFGNIAFTFAGDSKEIMDSQVFGFFSLTAIDNLQLDFGIGTDFQNTPLNLGLAVKYGADSWGIKFRTMFAVPIGDQPFGMLFDVLPYFVINESFRAYISAGVSIGKIKDGDISDAGWHVNPYIEVGEEWGPKFLAGIRVWSKGDFTSPTVNFELPIALIVSF